MNSPVRIALAVLVAGIILCLSALFTISRSQNAATMIDRKCAIPAERILKEEGNPLGRALLDVYCFAVGAGI